MKTAITFFALIFSATTSLASDNDFIGMDPQMGAWGVDITNTHIEVDNESPETSSNTYTQTAVGATEDDAFTESTEMDVMTNLNN